MIAAARRPDEPGPQPQGLRVLGHELKNALSAASFHLDLLSTAGAEGPMGDRIAAVRDALSQALGLSRQLSEEEREPDGGVEAAALARQCVRLAGAAIERRGRLLSEIPERVGEIALDELEGRQLVLNLLLNAGEAIEPGGTVTVSLRRVRGDRAIELSVADDGVGMSEETLASACVPGVSTKPDGSGLGLFRVQELVEKAGGSLRIRSAPGHGTCVTLELPRIGRRSGR